MPDKQTPDWEKDLSEIGRTLEESMRTLGNTVQENLGPALSSAAQSFGQAVKSAANSWNETAKKTVNPYRQQRKKEKFLKKLRENYEALKWTAFGLGITSFIMVAISFIMMATGDSEAMVPLVMAAAFGFPALVCKVQSYPARRLVAYHQVLDGRSYCKLDELAAAVDRPLEKTKKEVRGMLQKGSFEGMYLAPDASRLFTNRTAYLAYMASDREKAASMKTAPEAPKPAQPEKRGTLGDLRAFWLGLRMEKKNIADPAVSEQVENLDAQTAQLLAWLEAHPEDESRVKRFAEYYLPTTLKLLRTYNEVDSQAGQSSVAADIQHDITGILYTINTAFRTLQDGLLQDTALDVSAEISAMETVLAQDGLRSDGFLQMK